MNLSHSRQDRTVHARLHGDIEIVRYDRAGKWYLEGGSLRRQEVTLREAALHAKYWRDCTENGQVFLGLPGGGRFDQIVRADA